MSVMCLIRSNKKKFSKIPFNYFCFCVFNSENLRSPHQIFVKVCSLLKESVKTFMAMTTCPADYCQSRDIL